MLKLSERLWTILPIGAALAVAASVGPAMAQTLSNAQRAKPPQAVQSGANMTARVDGSGSGKLSALPAPAPLVAYDIGPVNALLGLPANARPSVTCDNVSGVDRCEYRLNGGRAVVIDPKLHQRLAELGVGGAPLGAPAWASERISPETDAAMVSQPARTGRF